MAWNEMNERRLKELELISSGLRLTAPQVEEIEELIDLKEQSDAKPEYRHPTMWDGLIVRDCEVMRRGGKWQAGTLYAYYEGNNTFAVCDPSTKDEEWDGTFKAEDIIITIDEDDIEWQFKCKMFDIIAGHAGDLNSRCFQAPFEDERTGRIYSLKLEWLNRERFCDTFDGETL